MKVFIALLCLIPIAGYSLDLRFDTSNLVGIGSDQVFIHFQGGASDSVSYGSNNITFDPAVNYLSSGISLQTLNQNGGFFDVAQLGGSIYISYMYALPGGAAAPSYIGATATTTQYERVELTHVPGNFNSGGNPTNINWFSFPVSVASYTQSNPSTSDTPIQSKGYTNPNAAQLASKIESISGFNSGFTVMNGDQVVRYLGPSSFPPPPGLPANPYPSWEPYLEAIHTDNTTTSLKNSSGFNIKDGAWVPGASSGSINYNFAFDLDMSVVGQTVDNVFQFEKLSLVGSITGTQTPFGGSTTAMAGGNDVGNPGVWNVEIDIWGKDLSLPQYDAENMAAFNAALYGGVAPVGFNGSELLTTDAGYALWLSEISAITGLNVGPNAAGSVLQAQIIGENSSGFAFGYINSTKTPLDIFPTYVGPDANTMFKDMDSSQWWSFNTLPKELQTEGFYNAWSALILEESNNQVYGQVYADRYSEPFNPFLFSLTADGTSTGDPLASWVITLYNPVPEPSSVGLLGMGALLVYAIRRRMRKTA